MINTLKATAIFLWKLFSNPMSWVVIKKGLDITSYVARAAQKDKLAEQALYLSKLTHMAIDGLPKALRDDIIKGLDGDTVTFNGIGFSLDTEKGIGVKYNGVEVEYDPRDGSAKIGGSVEL